MDLSKNNLKRMASFQNSCCLVSGCYRSGEDKYLSYHALPRTGSRRKRWLDLCRVQDQVTSFGVVCGKHFRQSDFFLLHQHLDQSQTNAFSGWQRTWMLRSDAVPSIFPWSSPNTPEETDPLMIDVSKDDVEVVAVVVNESSDSLHRLSDSPSLLGHEQSPRSCIKRIRQLQAGLDNKQLRIMEKMKAKTEVEQTVEIMEKIKSHSRSHYDQRIKDLNNRADQCNGSFLDRPLVIDVSTERDQKPLGDFKTVREAKNETRYKIKDFEGKRPRVMESVQIESKILGKFKVSKNKCKRGPKSGSDGLPLSSIADPKSILKPLKIETRREVQRMKKVIEYQEDTISDLLKKVSDLQRVNVLLRSRLMQCGCKPSPV